MVSWLKSQPRLGVLLNCSKPEIVVVLPIACSYREKIGKNRGQTTVFKPWSVPYFLLSQRLSYARPAKLFTLRSSNTEPLLRLNVESRGDRELMAWEMWGDSHSVG